MMQNSSKHKEILSLFQMMKITIPGKSFLIETNNDTAKNLASCNELSGIINRSTASQ